MSTEAAPPPVAETPPPAAPVETPWHESIHTPENPRQFVPDWHTKAPEEERGKYERYKGATNWREAFEMVESRRSELEKSFHRLKNNGAPVKPEGEAATPEALAAYYEGKGLPKTPADYGLKRPDDFPAELWDDNEAALYSKLFHEAEIPAEVAQKLAAQTQELAKQRLAAHQQAVQAWEAEQAAQKARYIQGEKEGLIQELGVNVESASRKLEKLAAVSVGNEKAGNMFNPEHDDWVGLPMFKTLVSMMRMLPQNGDPTMKGLGHATPNPGKDREYWKNLKNDHPDIIALGDPMNPRHKEVTKQRDLAYQLDAGLRGQ